MYVKFIIIVDNRPISLPNIFQTFIRVIEFENRSKLTYTNRR